MLRNGIDLRFHLPPKKYEFWTEKYTQECALGCTLARSLAYKEYSYVASVFGLRECLRGMNGKWEHNPLQSLIRKVHERVGTP